MVTAEENELLTRIGPGTRMGSLLRRYWHPVAGLAEMEDRWTRRVRLLGEDLVLFKDRTGKFGLIGEHCPHRGASLAYGIPTENGLRCPYHGWKFDGTGRCLEQPNEPESNALRDKVLTPAYPVEELGGLLFAYLGPLPAPLVPRYSGFVWSRAIRAIGKAVVPCNWLQIMENSVDPVHTEWLHGALYEFVRESEGAKVAISRHHVKIAFDEFEHGIVKRRLLEGQSEDSEDWRVGHPLVFPNLLSVGSGGGLFKQNTFQIRVPIDDTHTMHWWYHAWVPADDMEVPQHLLEQVPPVYEPSFTDDKGEYKLDFIEAGDIMAWVTQGPIANRANEHLGASDRGVSLFRKMLRRELEKSERGEDPLGVIRDPARNTVIELPIETGKEMYSDGVKVFVARSAISFSPIVDDLIRLFSRERPELAIRREPVSAK
jgi:5,5'-dehydrodivanillate O-demethylase oxygenase subunit